MTPDLPRLEARSLAAPGSLAGDLLAGAGTARSLLPAGALRAEEHPADGDGADDAPVHAGSAAGPDPGARSRIPAEALRTTGPGARRRLEEVLEEDGVMVTTGQQPLLFLGPSYVLYKALTAVVVAEVLRDRGTPAVALFWVAGDDHDWGEVGRTRLLDLENRLREVALEPPADREGRAVGPTELREGVGDHLDDLFDLLPDSEFKSDYLELFRDAYRSGRSASEAFGRALAGVMEGFPLAWLDSAAPAVRRSAAPLYRRVILGAGEVEEEFVAATRAVREAGYDPPIHHRDGGVPLFVDRPSGRTRLHRDGGDGLRLGRDGEAVARDRVLEELDAHPERFSPNVALRPVVSSWLLPTAATVLGPGEMAYWTQLPGLFRWADVPFPRLRPRGSWTVVEGKVEKVLRKLGADPDAFGDGGEGLIRRVRERGRPPGVQEALEGARQAVGETLATVEKAVEAELPGLRSAVGATRHEVFQGLDRLQDAVDRRVEEQNEVLLQQIRKAAAHLWPDGRPQERVISPLYYLARYGSAFVEHVAERTRRPIGDRAGTR